MESIAQQIERLLQAQSAGGEKAVGDYQSGLAAAAGQEENSLKKLNTLYSDKSKFEKPILGALGVGLMKNTSTGNFGEEMSNGLSAAIDTQDKNREINLTREEKLARLDALHGTLTRQTASDAMDVYNKKGQLVDSLTGNKNALADVELSKHSPFEDTTEEPGSAEEAYKRIYLDGLKNPQKYAGVEGQKLWNSAADMVKAGVAKTSSVFYNNSDLPQVQTNDQGVPDPNSQEQFLGTLPPNIRDLVKKIANYEMDISKVTSLRGGEREQIAALVSAYDPSFDMTQYQARAAMRKSVTSGSYSNALNASNLVIQHVDAMSEAFKKLNNTRFQWYNKTANAAADMTGDEEIQKALGSFNSAADAVANELAKVFKGVGATDMQSIQEWRHNLGSDVTPAKFNSAVETIIKDLLRSRIDTIKSQYTSAMGKPSEFKFLTPHSKEILQKNGIDVSEFEIDRPGTKAGAPAAAAADDGGAASFTGTVGDVLYGREYLGGDPSNPKSWGPKK